MNSDELKLSLDAHKEWINTHGKEGQRLVLKGAYLEGADLRGADLQGAFLEDAKLIGADLRGADLRGADLRGADLDFSAFPLWCGSLNLHIDDRIAIRLLYHLVRNVLFSKNTSEELKELLGTAEIIDTANRFHGVKQCGKIKK